MDSLISLLPYVQILLAVLLILGVLIQRSEAALGSAFGDDSWSSVRHERRGLERGIFVGSIVVAILFIASTLATLLIK